VEGSGDSHREDQKTELTQTQEMILLTLLVGSIRHVASVSFQMIWMGVIHLKLEMKFRLNTFSLVSKEVVKL
jgi:hypothetical protein